MRLWCHFSPLADPAADAFASLPGSLGEYLGLTIKMVYY
jgi:hypothetical protein